MKKHLPPINYDTILHSKQRYNTAGDYKTYKPYDCYLVSRLPQGWRAELAVFVHEIVEYQLCKEVGIKEKDITKFDIESGLDDPGASPKAPYYSQHAVATKIEKYIIKQLGLNWSEYDASFSTLKYKK